MRLIALPNGDEWFKANWVFRRLTDDVIRRRPSDARLKSALDQADALGGLPLDVMDSREAGFILQAIEEAVESVIRAAATESDGGTAGDADAHEAYMESLMELRSLIAGQR